MTHRSPSRSPIRLALLLATAASILVAGNALAQSWAGKGRVRGTVKTEDGKPIQGAEVYLFLDTEGNGPEALITDKKGKWEYLGLTGGTFTVRVAAEGYIPREGQVKINEWASNSTPPVHIELRSLETVQDQERSRLGAILDEANASMQAGDYDAAREGYAKVKEGMNDDAQIRQVDVAIAESYLLEGNSVEARNRFQALADTEEDPAVKAAYLQRVARTYYDEENVDRSIEILEGVLETQPDDVATLRMVIDILVSEGREADAEPYMDRLPEGEKVDADALLNVGIAAYNDGDVDTALEKFEKVYADYPDNPNVHYYLGLCYLSQGASDKAKTHFETMLELAPDHENAAEARDFLTYL